ncbi:MAG: hypothetical protein ACOYMA_13690 [Bacteroidia bacterium]
MATIYNTSFYNVIKESSGFNIPDHKYIYKDFINVKNRNNQNNEILLQGNKINYKMFWQIDGSNNIIILHKDSIQILSKHFAVLLNTSFSETKESITNIMHPLSFSEFFIEKIVFKMQGNWLLKHQNEYLHDLLEMFLFWFTKELIKNDTITEKYLDLFINTYAKEINFEILKGYTRDEILSAFMQSFFYCKNDLQYFSNMLNAIKKN